MSNNKRKERSEQKELADTRALYGHGKYVLAGVAAVVVLVIIAQLVDGLLFAGILAAIGFVVWGFWLRNFLANWRKVKNEQREHAETRALHDEVVQDKGLDEKPDELTLDELKRRIEDTRDVAEAPFEILDLFDDD